jgi:hypothetical protein
MSVASELEDLRRALDEVDVLAALTRTTFDDVDWTVPDSANVDVMATLLRLIDKSSFSAMQVFHRLKRAIGAQPAPASKDAMPGGPVAMSTQDAEVVRRVRERDPDHRFDGGSDAELLDLFRYNKRVLERSDDDVIAAMTHPR